MAQVNDYTSFFFLFLFFRDDIMLKSFPDASPLLYSSFFSISICMSSKSHQATHFFSTVPPLLSPVVLFCYCALSEQCQNRHVSPLIFHPLSDGFVPKTTKASFGCLCQLPCFTSLFSLFYLSHSPFFIHLRPLSFTSRSFTNQYCRSTGYVTDSLL